MIFIFESSFCEIQGYISYFLFKGLLFTQNFEKKIMSKFPAIRQTENGPTTFIEPSQEDPYQSELTGGPKVTFTKTKFNMGEHFVPVGVIIGM
jgi:hypothetical protein